MDEELHGMLTRMKKTNEARSKERERVAARAAEALREMNAAPDYELEKTVAEFLECYCDRNQGRMLMAILSFGFSIPMEEARQIAMEPTTNKIAMMASCIMQPGKTTPYMYKLFTKPEIERRSVEGAFGREICYTHEHAICYVAFYKLHNLRDMKPASASWSQFLQGYEEVFPKNYHTAYRLREEVQRVIHNVGDTTLEELTLAVYDRCPGPADSISSIVHDLYTSEVFSVSLLRSPDALSEHMRGVFLRARLVAFAGWPLPHFEEDQLYDFLMQLI